LGFLFGINVVGVVVLLYLIRASRFASGEFLDCAPPPVKRISVLVEERSTGPNDAPDHIRPRIVVSRLRSTRFDLLLFFDRDGCGYLDGAVGE